MAATESITVDLTLVAPSGANQSFVLSGNYTGIPILHFREEKDPSNIHPNIINVEIYSSGNQTQASKQNIGNFNHPGEVGEKIWIWTNVENLKLEQKPQQDFSATNPRKGLVMTVQESVGTPIEK